MQYIEYALHRPRYYLFGRNTDRGPNFDDPRLYNDAGYYGVPSIEDILWYNPELTGEDGDALVFLPLFLFHLLPVRHEFIKQVVDDVCLEDLNALPVCHLLGLSFHFDVKRQNDGISSEMAIRVSNQFFF